MDTTKSAQTRALLSKTSRIAAASSAAIMVTLAARADISGAIISAHRVSIFRDILMALVGLDIQIGFTLWASLAGFMVASGDIRTP